MVVLRALAKDPKARIASVAAFSAALEQSSKSALTPTGRIASEQSALNPAATGYETVEVAPNQPVLPTESTPSAHLPVGGTRADRVPSLCCTTRSSDTSPSETPRQRADYSLLRLLWCHRLWNRPCQCSGRQGAFLEPWRGISLDYQCWSWREVFWGASACLPTLG